MPYLSSLLVFILPTVAELRAEFLYGWFWFWNEDLIVLPINYLGFVFSKILVYLAHQMRKHSKHI